MFRHQESGTGPALVLLHGFPLTPQSFAPQLSAALPARVIVPWLLEEPPASIETIAQGVLELLDQLKIASATIGGVSMGGYVAMALLRLDPSRVKALVLIDTQATADDDAGRARREATAQQVEAEGIEPLVQSMLPKLLSGAASTELKEQVAAMMRTVTPVCAAAASRAMGQRAESKDILARFGGKALVVVGEADAITPPAKAIEIAQLVTGAKLVTLAGASHLSNLEAPAAFNAALRELLALD